jgi:hypothetical protein
MKALLLILLSAFSAFAQSTLTADVYLGMNGQTSGNTLTTAALTSGTVGTIGSWSLSQTPITGMTFANHRVNMRVPVVVGGVTYAVDYANKAVAMDNHYNLRNVYFSIPSGHRVVTVSGFITPGATNSGASNGYFDCVNLAGVATGRGCVLQLASGGTSGGGSGYRYRLEVNPGGVTDHSTVNITVSPDTTYWFTMNANFTSGVASLAMYETATWTQTGSTATATMQTGEDCSLVEFGNIETGISDGSTTYFEHFIVDYSNGVYPLGPGTPTTTTALAQGRVGVAGKVTFVIH